MHWPNFSESDLAEAVLETSGSVVLGLRPDHTICYWNRAAEQLYGLSAADAIGLDYVERFIAPEQRPLIAADIRKVLAGEPTWAFEDDSVLTNGERRTLVWNVKRFANGAGEICGILASGWDITSRKDAERAFRLVWDQSTEGLLIGGGPGIVDCNPAALRMLGLTDRAQLIGRHPLVFSPEFQPDGERSSDKAKRIDALTRELGEYRFEWMHQRTDGTPVPTEVHVRVVALDGQTRTVIAWLDLSERQATAEREAALRGQLLHSQKLDALGHLAGGIAHDFNNLLTALRGSLELALLDVDANGAVAAELRLAQETTTRAAALVRQLLAFSRQREATYQTLDLGALVRDAESMWRRVLPSNITLHVHTTELATPVWGDPGQLEQVCLNLVVNARDAMAAGGELRVHVGRVATDGLPRASLEVADSGTGMPASVMARVFDPFFTTKPLGAGTGLGLAVVYGTVTAHDGTVSIDSTVGEGTVVRVELPLALSSDAATGLAVTAELPVPTAVSDAPGPRGTVLLVEDEPAVRGALRRVLMRGGFEVIEATHGAEALTLWHADPSRIALVLSDVRMPVLSGPDLVRQLRAAGSRTPVLLMSGFADEELVRDLPPNVAQVLAKPFPSAALLAAARHAIAARADAASREAPAGPKGLPESGGRG